MMNEEEREKKIRFIEILLTVGGLLGTALTLTKVGQISEISLVSLPLFILFSIFYYGYLIYEPFNNNDTILKFDLISRAVAFFFSIIFANVIAIPIVNNISSIWNDFKLPAALIIELILVIAYLLVTFQTIYKILTKGIVMEHVKKNIEDDKKTKSLDEFKFSFGFTILILGLDLAMFGMDKLGIFHIPDAGLYTIVGFALIVVGNWVIYKSRK